MHLLGAENGSALRRIYRKTWQRGVESMMNKIDVTFVYQTADSAEDKIEGHKEWCALYPSFCQPLTGGDTGSRVFHDGLLTELLFCPC